MTLAVPGDPRPRIRALTMAYSLAAVTVVLAGCSPAQADPAGAGAIAHTAAQADAEYQAETKLLPALPRHGPFPPPAIPAHDNTGLLETYGPGFGNQIADSTWECIWMGQVLTDAPHTPAHDQDIQTLTKYQHSYIYIHQQLARQQFDPELQAAQRGDDSALANDYAANCSP